MIAIKDMKMPKNCYVCPFCERDMWCVCMDAYSDYMYDKKRHPNCPLVEVK